MKRFKVGGYLAAMVFLGLGVAMAVTNPTQEAYHQYAARLISRQIQEKECVKLDDSFRNLCKLLERQESQALLKRLVADNTQRQNFLLGSLYTTNLSTDEIVPAFLNNFLSLPTLTYRAETVGIFGQFQTYRIEQQER
jgi:site-specific recombinase XerD